MSAEINKGGSRLLCDGCYIMTKNLLPFLASLTALLVCSCLFFAVDCPVLTKTVSASVPVLGVILAVFVFGCLLATAFTDPGVVPRPLPDEAAHYESLMPDKRWVHSDRCKIIIRGHRYDQKFCTTCRLWRPPRTVHCSRCDNCVLRFDHHCVWVGNCIGARNYRQFFMFIVGLQVYSIFVLFFTLYHLFGPPYGDPKNLVADRIAQAPTSLVNVIAAAATACSMLIMMVYHIGLVCSELTTSEDSKQTYVISSLREDDQTRANPFDRGCLRNCSGILCGPIVPSLLRWDGGEPQHATLALQTVSKTRRLSHDMRSGLIPSKEDDRDPMESVDAYK